MPDCVAHQQFGQDILKYLAADLRACALSYKREYNIGLQGPDIFFFYKPYRRNDIVAYGHRCHAQPAKKMFVPILKRVREGASLAYLMGLICHYTLDAVCHPYVNSHSRDIFAHHRMEAAYDRYILSRFRTVKARYLLVPVSGLDFEAVASLWPGLDEVWPGKNADLIRKCLKAKRFYNWLVDRRAILAVLESVAGKNSAYTCLSLPGGIDREQREHVRHLDVLYSRALAETPQKIERALRAMCGTPEDLAGFDLNYRGEAGNEADGFHPI